MLSRAALSFRPRLVAAFSGAAFPTSCTRYPGSILWLSSPAIWRMATHRDRQHRFTNSPISPTHPGRHSHNPEPKKSWLESIPSDVIFYGIMVANGLVFGAWYMAKANADSTLWKFMHDNFCNSYHNLSSGRVWTILTSCFSHESTLHILFNGFTYYYIARPILEALGNARFLSLYLGGGMAAGLSSMFYNSVWRGNENYSSHGASAAIYSLLSFVACATPRSTVFLYAVIPMPLWAVVVGIFLFDGYSAVNDKPDGTDTVGHIGGLAAGIGYFVASRFGVIR